MRRIGTFILTAFASAAVAVALTTPVDGKWSGQSTVRAKSGDRTVDISCEFKSNGPAIAGFMKLGHGKRMSSVEVKDGKLDGDKLTFSTKMTRRKGEVTIQWEGTVKEGLIELKQSGRGRRAGPQTVTLKRVS